MDKPFGIGTYSQGGTRFLGACYDGKVLDINKALAGKTGNKEMIFKSALEIFELWQESVPLIQSAIKGHAPNNSAWIPLSELIVHAPIELPRQIFCTGANYRKHVVDLTLDMKVGPEGLKGAALKKWAEDMMDERAKTGEPYVFTKPVSAVAGPNDPIIIPKTTKKLDWELELAVIIGKRAYQVSREQAMDHVAGYAIVNDLSARDLIARTDYKMIGTDWLRAKGQPGFLPFGPMIVPSMFVPNPHDLRITLTVSGKRMQDESTADMLFGIERQIEYISRYAILLPGDIICTGSPAGNGTHYNRFLQPGDIMEGEIEGLGIQRSECVAP